MLKHSRAMPATLTLVFLFAAGCTSTPTATSNLPPTVSIQSPVNGSAHPETTALQLSGTATDPEDGALSGSELTWTSSIDGILGTGAAVDVSTLSVGNHTVTLAAVDSRGGTAQSTVSFRINGAVGGDLTPDVSIVAPAPGASYSQGTSVSLQGSVTDPEDGPLSGSALVWSSSLDGPVGTGETLTLTTLSVGTHLISLVATDGQGAAATATLTLTITPPSAPNLRLQPVVSGLSAPVYLTAPPGDQNRLFIVGKGGTIRVVKNGALLTAPFLDISDSVSNAEEQGLLGLAFYPDYATSGRFIVSYTSPHGNPGGAGSSVLARYQVSSGNADLADPLSAQVLLTVAQPYDNHNGGMITFGPDGYLYFGLGDGGLGGDPLQTGQDRTDLLGSMLRLDVSGSGGYTIPPTNPYATHATFRHELWNWGLRNPWRFSFDRQTGDLYIGDVGQDALEEIDVAPASNTGGDNYGWNIMEGLSCYNATTCNQSGLTLPVLDYGHSPACAVTGGYVYRGAAIPALAGTYFYGDYCGGWVRSFHYVNGIATAQTDWPSLAPGGLITSFGEDAAGELYVLTFGGAVFRIVEN